MKHDETLKLALKKLNDARTRYQSYENYYYGQHNLEFASDKFKNTFGKLFKEFALNLCPGICDATKDKLKVIGFRSEEGGESSASEAMKLWQVNRMAVRADEIHKQAIMNGDAYVLLYKDPDGKVTIYPQRADCCVVEYDPEIPGKIIWAAKQWKNAEKRSRVNLYFEDTIVKFISKEKKQKGEEKSIFKVNVDDYEEFTGNSDSNEFKHELGRVPVFHFANNADIGRLGVSELENAIPIQNALNKSVLDMLVAMEFSAFRQRWVSGIEIAFDKNGEPIAPFAAGVDKLWASESENTKFGDFEQTDLSQFLEVKDSFRVDMAIVTATPLYYFMQVGASFPSGEALKKSETRFINKVLNRQTSFGQVWEDLMTTALQMKDRSSSTRLTVSWEDPAPLSETDALENIALKQDIGISEEQALREAGYGDDDISRMLKEKEEKRTRETERLAAAFNAGEEEEVEYGSV